MKFRRFLISLSIATALLALSISDVKACTCGFVGPPAWSTGDLRPLSPMAIRGDREEERSGMMR